MLVSPQQAAPMRSDNSLSDRTLYINYVFQIVERTRPKQCSKSYIALFLSNTHLHQFSLLLYILPHTYMITCPYSGLLQYLLLCCCNQNYYSMQCIRDSSLLSIYAAVVACQQESLSNCSSLRWCYSSYSLKQKADYGRLYNMIATLSMMSLALAGSGRIWPYDIVQQAQVWWQFIKCNNQVV